jgi:ABC-type oligopeptide transport system substrate-binding subunit
MKMELKKVVAASVLVSALALFLTGCCEPEISGLGTHLPDQNNQWRDVFFKV